MLLTVEKIWSKVQEFVKRIGDLEGDIKENAKEVGHLKKELTILEKSVEHGEKVVSHHGHKLAELEARIKKLESEKHGARVSAGKAKAANAKLKEHIKVITGETKKTGKKEQSQKDLFN